MCEIPVGEINARPFLFVTGVGLDAEAVRRFENQGSRRFGRLGLMAPVLRALVFHRDEPLRIETDSGTDEARWVIVTRVRRYAANLMLAPEADVRGSRLHVLAMSGRGRLIRMAQLLFLAAGYLRFGPGVTFTVTSRVRIHGDPRVPVQTDGEVAGRLPLDIGIHSKKLTVIQGFPKKDGRLENPIFLHFG